MSNDSITHKAIEPAKEMSVSARNTQLWAFLNGMGLYVQGVSPSGESGEYLEDGVDCLIVSVAPPTVKLSVCEQPTEAGVSAPMEGTKVVDVVAATSRDGRNVVDFPTVL